MARREPGSLARQSSAAARASSKRLRLAFVCSGDPMNVRTWSGTPAHMLEALRRHADVVEVIRRPWEPWFDFSRRAVRRLTGRRYDAYWSPFWSSLGARPTIERLAKSDCDAVVAVAVTPIAARVAERKHTVYVSDATFCVMADYNENFRKLAQSCKEGAYSLERQAIQRATLATFPSDWARTSAIDDFKADDAHTHQIPWGANMEAVAGTPPQIRPATPLRLLFVGVDWHGKGGDTVLEAFEALRARGIDVRLDVAGCAPSDPAPMISGVTFHGFISKNTPEGRDRLQELFRRSHFIILPTRFEAFGIVLAEAASFGVPAISYRTGGLASNVRHGETGVLIEPGQPAEAFAEAIAELIADPKRYARMSNAAVRFSREALNWDSWARTLVSLLTQRFSDGGPII